MIRRTFTTMVLAGAVALGLGVSAASAEPAKELRVGFQKYGTLTLIKARGTLEKRLAPLGIAVKWQEFPAGPQLLEALNVGSVDFGTTGEAPPIFAQAAGAPFVYVGYEPPTPVGEAILVPKDSAIQSIADLKGKKVALNKGSNVHYLLVKALESKGLSIKDIQSVYLPPADARAAFERGSVDAWVIWDPFLIAAQRATQARVLADGTGLVSNHQFYLSTRGYARDNPKVIGAFLEEIADVAAWASKSPAEAAGILAPQTGIEAGALEIAIARLGYGVKPLNEQVVAEQQRIADTFFGLGLIPKKIDVRDALPAAGS
ncbi:sulfonate ABC transporter substrate-binding protein [Azospirillum sp. TSO22-1]|uniref:sulfonate ABC transporter substrate-binding protein n=1 Tax=Azospirillum sp. TSO22-1 TaxID=716789 RepID=UPI001FFEEDE0|nr:sulfonate ABC transporter substrate-binding protein [Azospirillum sp. TSO22-1]